MSVDYKGFCFTILLLSSQNPTDTSTAYCIFPRFNGEKNEGTKNIKK